MSASGVADTEVLRRHYDYTLQHWRHRFAATGPRQPLFRSNGSAACGKDHPAAVQVGFRNGSNMAFQLLLSQRIDSVPIKRDFMMVGARSSM